MKGVGADSNASLPPQQGMLMGRMEHALDPKKRLTIPASWRDVMASPAYVYVIPDPNEKCLTIVPPHEMEGRLQALRQKALFDPDATRALKTIGENSEQLSLDVQGRIRICDRLLQYAGLVSQVVMIGAVNRIQLWAPEGCSTSETVDPAKLGTACRLVGF